MSDKEIKCIDAAIDALVYDKVQIRKAYQYYHCHRDAEQFKHLEMNYGVGSPTSIHFTPLIKKHIDVLVGKYLELEPDLKISCKDVTTVSNIMRDKKLKIDQALYQHLEQHLRNSVISVLLNNKEVVNDPFIENELKSIQDNLDKTFVSDYEIAAQNILRYLKQSRSIDLKNKMRMLFTDLLISGLCYYRTKPTENKSNIQLEALNPLDTFVEKNPNSPYLADSRRAVIRKYMTREMILNEYRSELTHEAVKKLKETNIGESNNSNTYFIRASYIDPATNRPKLTPGLLGGLEAHPTWPGDNRLIEHYNANLITVYEVEWLDVDESTGRLTRHEGVKIGSDIYITRGESEFVVRSVDYPSKCRLSINGLFFLDTNGEPFSLMINTMSLQDRYDLLHYYRDNLIASSGTVGDWIDLANLPTVLGESTPERIQKWLAYKKNGVGLIDTSQEGQPLNTIFNGFDDTVKAQSIQAIQLAIQSIEQQASSITGVLQEMLAQYEQRDAVSNVKLGVTTSGLLTKQYFDCMDTIYKEVNYDLLNLAKLVYPKGMSGIVVLGDRYSKIFEALPEHYTITDFDIHIEDSTATFKDRETIKALSTELVKAGYSDPEMLIDIVSAKNMTELRNHVGMAMRLKKEENNILQQMQQQLQQLQQENQALNKQNQDLQESMSQLQKKAGDIEQARIQLEKQRVELDKVKIENDKRFNEKTLEIKQQQVDAQVAQIFDNNPHNDKIKTIL